MSNGPVGMALYKKYILLLLLLHFVSYIAFLTSVVSEIKQEIVSELIRNILHKNAPAISKDSRNSGW